MKDKNWIIGLFFAAMFAFTGIAHADTTIYDKNWNVKGYKKSDGHKGHRDGGRSKGK